MKRIFVLFSCCLIASCGTEKPQVTTIRDEIHGISFLAEHAPGPALSRSEDRLYVKIGSGRELVFEGYGGNGLKIRNLGESIIVVEYCDGTIEKVASFLSKSPVTGDALAVKIQPVIAKNVQIGTNVFCSDHNSN